MAVICRAIPSIKTLTHGSALPWYSSSRSLFTKTRLPKEVLEERSHEHERFGGDPEQPHKLHIVSRVRSTKGRPYWEKKTIADLGLEKPYSPVIHKNIPAVNNMLKTVKHLIKIQPLKLPHGLPAEEDMAESYLNTKGELIIRRLLKPIEPKAIDS